MDVRTWLLDCTPAEHFGQSPWPWGFWLPGVPGALAWMDSRGLRPGSRLALIGANTPACAALLQAATLRGITVVLVNRRLHRDEMRSQLVRSQCQTLATTADGALADAGLPGILLLPDHFAELASYAPPTPLNDQDAALVVFSSGTSGQPKAVRLSLMALRHAAAAAVACLTLVRGDEWLGCLPLDHIGGASLVYRAGLCGHALRLVERFDVGVIEHLLDTSITGASVVPTMLHRLVAARSGRPWSGRLRMLLTGGGPLSDDLAHASQRLGLYPCATYGLTEAASQVCTNVSPPGASSRSCGRPLPGMRVRITRPDGSACAVDERGTIEIAGSSLFSGYEEAGALVHALQPGQWFATGDIGSLDANGLLFVHGRRDDVIISGGEKIDPVEIEGILERHPMIAEAGVYGAADDQWGQVVSALLVARGEPPEDSALSAWLAETLSGFKRPRTWRFVAQLPRTITGKLQRRLLGGWQSAR